MLLCWGNWVKPVKISSKTSSNPLKPVANWKNRFLSFLNYSTVVKDVSLLVKGKILSDFKFSVYLIFKKRVWWKEAFTVQVFNGEIHDFFILIKLYII